MLLALIALDIFVLHIFIYRHNYFDMRHNEIFTCSEIYRWYKCCLHNFVLFFNVTSILCWWKVTCINITLLSQNGMVIISKSSYLINLWNSVGPDGPWWTSLIWGLPLPRCVLFPGPRQGTGILALDPLHSSPRSWDLTCLYVLHQRQDMIYALIYVAVEAFLTAVTSYN